MQPCDELKKIVLHHYGKFDFVAQADSIKEIYSLQDGVIIIGKIQTSGLMIAIPLWLL